MKLENCPVCGEPYVVQSKDISTHNHNYEDLKKGHGRKCKNGHRWTDDTPDGKVIFIDTGIKLTENGRRIQPDAKKPNTTAENFNNNSIL